MNTAELTYLIKHPNNLTSQDLEKLENISEEFPFFQSARAIQLKGLYNSKSYKYNTALKKTAAYTIDRNVLFEFITSTPFLNEPILKEIEEQNNFSENTEVITDLDTESKSDEKLLETKSEATDFLELGKPIKFKNSDPHTFNEWMKLGTQKPIQREDKISDKLNIIDQFIKANPKIKPVAKQQSNIDISTESTAEDENLMTETLAKVYLEQKKYTKAIQAYHILSLKYPEKSSFFANRIKAIKILQINKS
ncbi:MAG: hypothetical protein R3342_12430 [Lutibacter sp.]|uniref:hypothetical protein n=1 Tax=Lutibacter sp. TaxID=1925666 RepID=UPI00299DB37C|nr:hypothetical protein [Lutibacter sp.]MDX1830341.1 hypothetical protein [Lutibacter sp.]